MTYSDTFPERFTKVDGLSREDHTHLTVHDHCYFLGEYTARRGFAYSATNDLIFNFKKPMDRQGENEWKYKERAIESAADPFGAALSDVDVSLFVFVPMPPSRPKGDPLYDDRLVKMLRLVVPDLKCHELIQRTTAVPPVHESSAPRDPKAIEHTFQIGNPGMIASEKIAVVDNMLTTGAHFQAAKTILRSRFPQKQIAGLFLARRVPETDDL